MKDMYLIPLLVIFKVNYTICWKYLHLMQNLFFAHLCFQFTTPSLNKKKIVLRLCAILPLNKPSTIVWQLGSLEKCAIRGKSESQNVTQFYMPCKTRYAFAKRLPLHIIYFPLTSCSFRHSLSNKYYRKYIRLFHPWLRLFVACVEHGKRRQTLHNSVQ